MTAFAAFAAVLAAFVLWVMIWRANLRNMAAKPWYVRHLNGLLRGGALWCAIVAVLIALDWKDLEARGRERAAAAASAKAWQETVTAANREFAAQHPSAVPIVANVAPSPSPPAAPAAAKGILGPDVGLSDMAPPPRSTAEPARAALAQSLGELTALFEKLGLSFGSAPLADGTPRLLGKTADGLTSVELIGHGEAVEKASLMFALTPNDPAATARNTAAVMLFMRDTGWENGWKWAIDSINKKTVKKKHGAVDYELLTPDGLPICFLSATPAGDIK